MRHFVTIAFILGCFAKGEAAEVYGYRVENYPQTSPDCQAEVVYLTHKLEAATGITAYKSSGNSHKNACFITILYIADRPLSIADTRQQKLSAYENDIWNFTSLEECNKSLPELSKRFIKTIGATPFVEYCYGRYYYGAGSDHRIGFVPFFSAFISSPLHLQTYSFERTHPEAQERVTQAIVSAIEKT